MWGMIPSYFLDLFVGNFLLKKVEGYLCSLIGDLLNKFIRRNYDSRTNPFKGGADGMTRDRHENIESFQGFVTRSRARKIGLEMQINKLRKV
ncbi:hypothetical protein M9H77_02942 [Catharanthus roseus]|uniref:Uncharacterized protein n=1 Tax=Catharanthus roseus TaxID=4058 RepID=A0ACC0CA03_CATRO|nr:hypothetical protein M9H77_02942 [Catharanthus roseus]